MKYIRLLLISVLFGSFAVSAKAQKIYVVEYESQADLKIFKVEYESQAGWKNKEKQYLLF